MTRINLATIPGDGIGPEVVAEGLKVLRAAIGEDAVEVTEYPFGAAHYLSTGEVLSEDSLEALKARDVICTPWEPYGEDQMVVRFCSSWATTSAQVAALAEILDEVK